MTASIFSNTVRKAGALSRIAGALLALVLMLGLNQAARADAGFVKNFVIVNPNNSGNAYYRAGGFAAMSSTSFDGLNLGNFTRTGTLVLNGGQSQIYKNTANVNSNVTSVRMYYRVYRSGTFGGAFSTVNLPFASDDISGNSDAYQTWQTTTSAIDLLSAVRSSTTNDSYTIEVYFDATDGGTNPASTFTDNKGGANYKATFTLDAGGSFTPAGQSTTWISNTNTAAGTDWLNSVNWSNGVPTSLSDALVPDHATGTAPTVSPQLNDPSATYEVRNLNMPVGGASRSIVRLGQSTGGAATGATLRIYGNLTVPGAGLLGAVSGTNGAANPATNSTLVFAGNSTQFIQGIINNVVDVRIEGTGDKKINGTLAVPNTLTFVTGTTARLMTVDAMGNIDTSQSNIVNLKDSGILFGETNSAYVVGILQADRPIVMGVTQTFGNIGVDITSNRNIPSPNITVTRNTGEHFAYASTITTIGINRIYGVSGDVNNSPTVSTVVFHYLDSDGTNPTHSPADNELNGIQENNLVLFRTANGNSGPFIQLAAARNTTNNTFTLNNVTAINTITAGDQTAPLPVNLTKFNAVRNESNALLTWTTASETNNKGFYVQVATDGVNFRDLTFVPSQSANSLNVLNYSYIDKEANKTGKRYYRLLQTDLDGKGTYSPVQIVNFDGAASSSIALAAYPNPFADALSLTIDGGSAVHVKLMDATGRLVREQDIPGDSSPSINGLSNLNAGIYMAKVTLADGSTQTVRIQKQ